MKSETGQRNDCNYIWYTVVAKMFYYKQFTKCYK